MATAQDGGRDSRPQHQRVNITYQASLVVFVRGCVEIPASVAKRALRARGTAAAEKLRAYLHS